MKPCRYVEEEEKKRRKKSVRFLLPVLEDGVVRDEIPSTQNKTKRYQDEIWIQPVFPTEEKKEDKRCVEEENGITGLRRVVLPELVRGIPYKCRPDFLVVLELENVLYQSLEKKVPMTPQECVEMHAAGRSRTCRGKWLQFRPHIDSFLRFLFKPRSSMMECEVVVWTHIPLPEGRSELEDWVRASFGRFSSRIRCCYTQLDTLGGAMSMTGREVDPNKKDLRLLAYELSWPLDRILLIDHNASVIGKNQQRHVYVIPSFQSGKPLSFEFHIPLIVQQCLQL